MPNDETIQALGIAIAANVPTVIWGPPGTGKTACISRIAEVHGFHLEVVIASLREPSDFAGLPFLKDGQVHLAAPAWAVRLAEAGEGVLFLDELSTATPAVQAALLRVVLDRVVGDVALPPGVRVVAAANPPEQAAGTWDLSAPTANRFCHMIWEPRGLDVADGFLAGFAEPGSTDGVRLRIRGKCLSP